MNARLPFVVVLFRRTDDGRRTTDDRRQMGTLYRASSAGSRLFHVNHLPRHAAVDQKIRAGDEAGALRVEQELHHRRDILRLADAAGRMLRVVLLAQLAIILRPDPSGADAIDAHVGREADRERVGEREQPAPTMRNKPR